MLAGCRLSSSQTSSTSTIGAVTILQSDLQTTSSLGNSSTTTDTNVNSQTTPVTAISIPATDYTEVVTFPDAALEQAIRNAIDKPTGDIYQSDLDKLTDFSAMNMCTDNFQDLTGLEHCVNLQSLEILATSLNIDLTPLGSLHKLKSLQLFTSATDIAPLEGLTALTSLSLDAQQTTDITPLSQLTNLTDLTLTVNFSAVPDLLMVS
jgi:Leucine-rich repeat (LRR) protein